jgi:hypothetical protein
MLDIFLTALPAEWDAAPDFHHNLGICDAKLFRRMMYKMCIQMYKSPLLQIPAGDPGHSIHN